jgi:hypothetical protein
MEKTVKRKLTAYFLGVMFLFGLSMPAIGSDVMEYDSEFQCVGFMTDCGVPGVACGFDVGQIAADMVYWNSVLCSGSSGPQQ